MFEGFSSPFDSPGLPSRSGSASPPSDAMIAKAWLEQEAPVPSELTEEQRTGLMTSIGQGSLGALSAFGNVLDLPGSSIRDTIGGENPFDQWLPWNWTRSENRLTGREALHRTGLATKNDPDEWELADLGGFGAEVAMDPLTYLTFGTFPLIGKGVGGLGKLGRAASKAHLLDDAADVATRVARKGKPGPIATNIGKHEARRITTLNDFLQDPELIARFGKEELKKRIGAALSSEGIDASFDASGKLIGKAGTGKLGSDARFVIPFTNHGFGVSLGKFPTRKVDQLNAWVGNSKIGMASKKWFDAASRNLSTKYGQRISKLASRFQGQRLSKVAEDYQEAIHHVDAVRSTYNDFLGNNTGQRLEKLLGGEAIEGITRTDLKVGNVISMPEKGNIKAVITGQTGDHFSYRVWSKRRGEYVNDTISKASGGFIDGLKVIDSGSAGVGEDLLETVFESMISYAFEEGHRPFHGPGFGPGGTLANPQLMDTSAISESLGRWTKADALGTARGGQETLYRKGDSAEKIFGAKGFDQLSLAMADQFPLLKESLDKIRNEAVDQGLDIGLIDGVGWLPRDVTKSTAARLTEEQRMSHMIAGSSAASTEDVVNLDQVFSVTSEGRRSILAGLPRHQFQRMLNESQKHLPANVNTQTLADQLTDIKKMLGEKSSRHGFAEVLDRAKIFGEDRIEELAKEIQKHSPHAGGAKGVLYKSDVLSGVAKYVRNLSNMRATHMASLSVIVRSMDDSARQAAPLMEGVPLHEALRKAGHDIGEFDPNIMSSAALSRRKPGEIAGSLKKIAELQNLKLNESELVDLAYKIIPRELANQLEMTVRVTNPADEVNGMVLKFFDKFTSMFKGNVTLPFPSFAMRNFISGQTVNITSGDVGGVRDLVAYFKSAGVANKMANLGSYKAIKDELGEEAADFFKIIGDSDVVGNKHFDDIDQITEAEHKMWYTGQDSHAPDRVLSPSSLGESLAEGSRHVYHEPKPLRSMVGAEVSDDATPLLGPLTGKPRELHRAALATGSKVNRKVEWWNRISALHYLMKHKGLSLEAAKRRVDDLQFDYGSLADFEKKVMRRSMPFYSFTRKMAPLFFETIATHPGGGLGKLIRAERLGTQESTVPGDILPEHITQSGAVPLTGMLGPKEEGAWGGITGSPFAHEDTLSYLSGLSDFSKGDFGSAFRRGGLQLLSRGNPLPKGLVEYLTHASTHQMGPGGYGRSLDEQNPALAQTAHNISQGGGFAPSLETGQFRKPDPLFGMPVLEHLSANLPSSRAVSTTRMLADPRKGIGEKAINLLSGVKTTTLSPYQKRKAARESIQTMAEKGRYGGLFKSPRIDRIRLVELYKDGKISEREFNIKAGTERECQEKD